MFRRRKTSDSKAGGDLVPNAPNLADEEGGGWYKKPATRKADSDPDINVPPDGPLAIPESAQSMAPTYYDGGGGGSRASPPSRPRHQKKAPRSPISPRSPIRKHVNHSVDELCAVIGLNDWNAATRIIDEDPKVVSKLATLTLKGQRTVCNPLHLVAISTPPLDFLERVLREYPSAAHNPDRNGDRTALHWACIANASPAIIETIANAHLGACKHQDRTHGRTPLHYLAMQATEPEQIHALMEADMRAAKVKDNSLKTPLDLAQDSSNPFKLDIIPAIQARKLSEGLFAGLKKIRNASPGKYRATSPGKYNKRTPSPGKYNKRNASPGKYAAPDLQAQSNAEGDNQGSADRGRPGRSSRSERRSSRSERASMPIAGASAAAAPMIGDQLRGFMPLLGQPNGMDNDVPSRRVHQYHGSSVDGISHGTDSSEEVVSGEFGAPPRVVQSTSASLYAPRSQFPAPVQSMASYTSPGNFSPPRRTQTASSGYSSSYSNSPIPPAAASRNRSYSPKLTSSRDHSPKSTSSRDQSPMPPRIVRGGNSSQPRSSNSSQPRHSNQSIADGMDESIRELRIQLERKRGVLREKDNEIHQISDQILQAAREEGTMSRQLEQARSSGVDQNALFEKQGKVLRLKQQIDDLKAELRRAEKEVKKMESKSPAGSGNLDFMEQQLHLKKDEQSTLRAVMEALEDEKKSAKREVDNIDSELKSLETIQMLAQGEDIG